MKPPYQKAGPIRRGHLRRASLWLGDDHVLLVTGTRFFEKYRRFYYNEIQAITIRRERRFIFPVYASLATLACGIALLAGVMRHSAVLKWTAAEALAAIAIERYIVAMFQSCYTHLYTSVSSEELPSLHKYRSAAKAVALLEQRIQQAQGPMPEGWQSSGEFEPARIATRAPAPLPLQPTAGATTGQTRWAGVAFIGLIVYAVLDYLYLWQAQVRWTGLAIKIALLIEAVLCIYGYIQLYQERKNSLAGYLLLGAVFFAGSISYAENLILSWPMKAGSIWSKIPMHNTGMPVVGGLSIGGSILLGVIGLFSWLRTQRFRPSGSDSLSILDRS